MKKIILIILFVAELSSWATSHNICMSLSKLFSYLQATTYWFIIFQID